MIHATMTKFGYPETAIAEYPLWCALLRPAQATLGALVLVAKSEAKAFAELDAAAFLELGRVVRDTETALKAFRSHDRLNYLMLMMVDPHVHFHVLPRYSADQSFADATFVDAGWPGVPDLRQAPKLTPQVFATLLDALKSSWPRSEKSL
jgi:diadenosine tetraphosphate (Ap4A) HIT family hydrolase